MSYSVQLFRKETKELAEASGNVGAFLESGKGLKAFTSNQLLALRGRLTMVGFEKTKGGLGIFSFKEHYRHTSLSAEALLTKTALYLSASGEEAIFEILMWSTEWNTAGAYVKYDPQEGKWEDFSTAAPS